MKQWPQVNLLEEASETRRALLRGCSPGHTGLRRATGTGSRYLDVRCRPADRGSADGRASQVPPQAAMKPLSEMPAAPLLLFRNPVKLKENITITALRHPGGCVFWFLEGVGSALTLTLPTTK